MATTQQRKDVKYVSEFTRFINDYLAEHPEIIEQQKLNRRTYWDSNVDPRAPDTQDRDKSSDT